jgi:hypothetical protein
VNYTLLTTERAELLILEPVFYTRLFVRTLSSLDRQAYENVGTQLQSVTPELGGLYKLMTDAVNMTMHLQHF